MKRSLLLVAISVVISFGLWVLAVAVQAQDEVPPAYAGLKNPFSWNDATAQEAGKRVYQQSCAACHGATGGNIAAADFSSAGFPKDLEQNVALNFWILSEGRLEKGMPPFKSSLSQEQRWQVLTYIWSLGKPAPAGETPSPKPPATGQAGTLSLTILQMAQAGQPLTLRATLQDTQSKPVDNAQITFLIRIDFFTNGLMYIGNVLTDDKGIAILKYAPRQDGNIEVIARYETMEAKATTTLAENNTLFYQPEAGIKLPTVGQEIFIGPASSYELEGSNAPTSALRLPGGLTSWLLLAVITVIVVWGTYFRVVYQMFRIPIRVEIKDTDTRVVPTLAIAVVVILGTFLVLKLVTGPYTHLNLVP